MTPEICPACQQIIKQRNISTVNKRKSGSGAFVTTIPKKIAVQFGLKNHNKLKWELKENSLEIKKVLQEKK